MITSTPRTRDQVSRYYDDATGQRVEYVPARFARQLERELRQREHEIETLKSRHDKIREVLTPCASNRRFMQIAGPAREVLNLLKR